MSADPFKVVRTGDQIEVTCTEADALNGDASQPGGSCFPASERAISAWVVPTSEERRIARHTLGFMKDKT